VFRAQLASKFAKCTNMIETPKIFLQKIMMDTKKTKFDADFESGKKAAKKKLLT
jgi:hypothetical protein